LIINASNRKRDIEWLNSHVGSLDVRITDLSDRRGRLALQGPSSEDILNPYVDEDLGQLNRFHFINTNLNQSRVFIARTGYTGEDGFEISFDSENSLEIWQFILEIGAEYGILPIGLGARDTLRLEACYSLYGHELTLEITPIEAGIGWVVKDKKEDFIGKQVLLSQKTNGTSRKIVGIELLDKGILRENFKIIQNGKEIGYITSGTFSPLYKKSIGLAMMDIEYSNIGTQIDVNIRGRNAKAVVVKTPFYVYNAKKR
jgi:aminomethyltransferase